MYSYSTVTIFAIKMYPSQTNSLVPWSQILQKRTLIIISYQNSQTWVSKLVSNASVAYYIAWKQV